MKRRQLLFAALIVATTLAGCGAGNTSAVPTDETSVSVSAADEMKDDTSASDESSTSASESEEPQKEEKNESESQEDVTVALDKEYSAQVRKFFDAYIAGEESIPETHNSVVTYQESDPGYILFLDVDGDGNDEVFTSLLSDSDSWMLVGQTVSGRSDTFGYNHFSNFIEESKTLVVLNDGLSTDENGEDVIESNIDFYQGGWKELHFTEGYTQTQNSENIVTSSIHYVDGNSTHITAEEYDALKATITKKLADYKDRIIKITPENVEKYFAAQ